MIEMNGIEQETLEKKRGMYLNRIDRAIKVSKKKDKKFERKRKWKKGRKKYSEAFIAQFRKGTSILIEERNKMVNAKDLLEVSRLWVELLEGGRFLIEAFEYKGLKPALDGNMERLAYLEQNEPENVEQIEKTKRIAEHFEKLVNMLKEGVRATEIHKEIFRI